MGLVRQAWLKCDGCGATHAVDNESDVAVFVRSVSPVEDNTSWPLPAGWTAKHKHGAESGVLCPACSEST
jgi:hypothetical protein